MEVTWRSEAIVFSFDENCPQNKPISASAHAFLVFSGYLWFSMGNIKVATWNGLKILIPKHMWKSKIGLLEQIWAQNPYDTFFGSPCTMYSVHANVIKLWNNRKICAITKVRKSSAVLHTHWAYPIFIQCPNWKTCKNSLGTGAHMGSHF